MLHLCFISRIYVSS